MEPNVQLITATVIFVATYALGENTPEQCGPCRRSLNAPGRHFKF